MQPKNFVPAFGPFLTVRSAIGFLHFGQGFPAPPLLAVPEPVPLKDDRAAVFCGALPDSFVAPLDFPPALFVGCAGPE